MEWENTGLHLRGLRPPQVHHLLAALDGDACTLQCDDPQKLVSDPGEKLTVWEYHLGKEALATKSRCDHCHSMSLLPTPGMVDGCRQLHHWCTSCHRFAKPTVSADDYPLPPIPVLNTVPLANPDRLGTPITETELRYYLRHLPKHKAPGPDELPYELLQEAGPLLVEYLLEGVNEALEGKTDWPTIWKGGHIRLLPKPGPPTEVRNFRPVVLLSCDLQAPYGCDNQPAEHDSRNPRTTR